MQVLDAGNEAIEKAIELLKQGELVVYPTDTLYALGADATSEDAVKKIFAAKQRTNPISVMVSDYEMLKRHAVLEPWHTKFVKSLFPGKTTLIFKSNDLAPNLSQNGTVGFRVPSNAVALRIVEKTGPVTVTSANLSGRSAFEISDVADQLGSAVALYIEAGRKEGEPSTIVSLVGEPSILREGADLHRVKDAIRLYRTSP